MGYLDRINFVNAQIYEEVGSYLRKERDGVSEKRIKVLEDLRGLLEKMDVGGEVVVGKESEEGAEGSV